MREAILQADESGEFFIPERCFILELSNSDADDKMSIARARVEPGVTTQLHRLVGVEERYLVVAGRGRMEVGELEPREVGPGDVVLIPAGVAQRITNIAEEDLVFLCVCTPRFFPECYEALGE